MASGTFKEPQIAWYDYPNEGDIYVWDEDAGDWVVVSD